MNEQTPEPDSFDALLAGAATPDEEASAVLPARRRWPFAIAAALLLLLGSGALAAAALLPRPEASAASPAPSPSATPAATTPRPVPSLGAGSAVAVDEDTPIAELADPEWIARVAAAGDIPERALAAYAGAALSVAQSAPSCGLGWNTLAAIGFVESEHGTISGSSIGDDGVATPEIIGVALDGNGVGAVPDTDGGGLDGDAVWDHAVGPMQFIPSTWEQTAQDGDKDGIADAQQIDDAALTAAVHLCEVGGDLTESANWIAAIGAYNDTVEYNNRVAEAANAYALLG